MMLAAEFGGDQQRTRADLSRSRQRRDVDKGQIIHFAECEQSGSPWRGSDDVVVAERSAVIAIRIRAHVADWKIGAGHERLSGPGLWHRTTHSHQLRTQ